MIQKEKKTLNRKIAPKIVDSVDLSLRLRQCEKHVLRNGVEAYIMDAGAEEVMLVEWVFFAGNCFEDKNLLAATTNFLLRNGTKNRTAFELNEHFEFYGAHLNRACYNETASVTLHTLSRHLPELLPVVREIFSESVFPETELETYRRNMQQRLAVNLRKNDFVAGRLIDTYLHGESHPYGKFSRHEDFDALTREEIIEYYNKYYCNGRFIIFAAGKVPEGFAEMLDQQFGDLPVQQHNIPEIKQLPATERKYRVINDPAGVQGAIRMARQFPNRHHPDFLPAQVLNNVFGGFFGSRLMANIREEKGYTYGIYSYLENHIQCSAWVVSTEAGRDVSEATVKEVYKEMQELREKLIDDEELSLVRNYMMGSILGDLDGPFHLIARWKNLILNGLDASYFDRTLETIRTVTAVELRELARKYLSEEDFYELIVV